MKKIMILWGLMLTSVAQAATLSADFTIFGLGISATTNTIFVDVNENHNHPICTDRNSFRLDTSNPLYKEIYATFLMAYTARKTVVIYYSDENNCQFNSPIIGAVFVK